MRLACGRNVSGIACPRTLAAHHAAPERSISGNPTQGNVPLPPRKALPPRPRLRREGGSLRLRPCGVAGRRTPLVVIGELKLAFNLELVLQGIDRTAACDEVWLAVRTRTRAGRDRDPRVRKLCRFLGFGLLGVSAAGGIEVLVEPAPWRPRRDAKRRSRIVDEHRRRLGDPALGGTAKVPIMTAYRQQALTCAALLSDGPRRMSHIKASVPDAPKMLLRNVYGWFKRVERGTYALTASGTAALSHWTHLQTRSGGVL